MFPQIHCVSESLEKQNKTKNWSPELALDYWIRISWAEAQESVFLQSSPDDSDKQPGLTITGVVERILFASKLNHQLPKQL